MGGRRRFEVGFGARERLRGIYPTCTSVFPTALMLFVSFLIYFRGSYALFPVFQCRLNAFQFICKEFCVFSACFNVIFIAKSGHYTNQK